MTHPWGDSDWRHDIVKEHIKGEVGTIEIPVPYAVGFSEFLTTDPAAIRHILKDNFDNCMELTDMYCTVVLRDCTVFVRCC